FAGWTADGHVRQAVFQGLRDDKPPRQITREMPRAAPDVPARAATRGKTPAASRGKKSVAVQGKSAAPPALALPAGLRITHPERVIDASTGITKGELVAYYAQVAPLLLPHLKDRPVSLLRAPDGVEGEQFFQKHAQPRQLPLLDRLDAKLDP